MFKIEGKKYLVFWVLAPVLLGVGLYFFREHEKTADWITIGLTFYVLFISIVIHEISHGLAAEACGDPTARSAGRLTFNLIKHVSVVGSIIVPLGLYLLNTGFILGWAKGVPFNPTRLRRFPRDQVFLSVMGPLSNFTLAFICFILFALAGLFYNKLHPEATIEPSFAIINLQFFKDMNLASGWFVLFHMLYMGLLLNLVLGVFNLIPFPPLDGSWILKSALPQKMAHYFNKIQPFAFILLIFAVHFGWLTIFMYPVIILLGLLQSTSGLIWIM